MTDTDIDYRFTHTGSLADQLNLTGLHNLRRAGAVDGDQPDPDKTIVAGKDRRGYRFFGVCVDGLLRIVAGPHRGNQDATRQHRGRGAGAWVADSARGCNAGRLATAHARRAGAIGIVLMLK